MKGGDIISTKDLKDIHYMCHFNPYDPQYSRYIKQPGILAAGHKVVDCYTAICQARTHLSYYECNDFGELAPKESEISILWARSQMIEDALIYYNIAVDLSWQVVWAYYKPTSLKLLFSDDYHKISKECTLEELNILLNKVIESNNRDNVVKSMKKLVNQFSNEQHYTKLRKCYNYMKHRGGYHVPGLGNNDKYLMCSLGGKRIPILSRQEMDINDMYTTLLEFDKKYVDYLEKIVNKLIPEDYTNSNIDIGSFAENYADIILVLNNMSK